MSKAAPTSPTLAWTGERMIPGLADSATEMFHWQRYLYFRPWYEGKRVVDAASGEGYGSNYASAFASEVRGFDIDQEAVDYANAVYPASQFAKMDVCEVDYSQADLTLSFETIEHLPDPSKFLKALESCPGTIVISTPNRDTHSPGNRLADKPLNPHHTVEWTPSEFAQLVGKRFKDRKVRFLSQLAKWPGTIVEGLRNDAMYAIAVIGEGELPVWPRLGVAMPTRNADLAINAVVNLSRYYPGESEYAIVSNGCKPEDLAKLRAFRDSAPDMVHLIENATNEGYGAGANSGLLRLASGKFDLFGVVNDDVYPAVDCVCQIAAAYQELDRAGQKPGLIGPVSNSVNGAQSVDIGKYADIKGMQSLADDYHRACHSRATKAIQVRGLFMLISPDCLRDVGGFDPRFGVGNFEDDDYNCRAREAGYTLWIADGAFLHHTGSATFQELNVDRDANWRRNLALLLEKWRATDFKALMASPARPEALALYQPLDAKAESSGFSMALSGETVDLVHQASDLEFAAYVMNALGAKPRKYRERILRLLQEDRAA